MTTPFIWNYTTVYQHCTSDRFFNDTLAALRRTPFRHLRPATPGTSSIFRLLLPVSLIPSVPQRSVYMLQNRNSSFYAPHGPGIVLLLPELPCHIPGLLPYLVSFYELQSTRFVIHIPSAPAPGAFAVYVVAGFVYQAAPEIEVCQRIQ